MNVYQLDDIIYHHLSWNPYIDKLNGKIILNISIYGYRYEYEMTECRINLNGKVPNELDDYYKGSVACMAYDEYPSTFNLKIKLIFKNGRFSYKILSNDY